MEKKILFITLYVLTSYSISAQNLFNSESSGFEGGKSSGWWVQDKEIFNFSTKKYNNGSFSLRFFRSYNDRSGETAKVVNREAFPKGLKSGKYRFKAKVLLNLQVPKGFNFNLKGKNYKSNYISLEGLPKRKWVEVSKTFTLEKKLQGSGAIISVRSDNKYGGKGMFYLDDIVLERIK